MTMPAGTVLGRYHLIELLGAGGMGVVYRARDERLQRDVAIKVLPPAVVSDEIARRRFRREALALARLSHPNIAAVYDVGEEGGTAYLVMECVAGESLAVRLERGALPPAEALDVTVQIARALADAHEQGIVHRDLKPANVMISPKGQVKVLDFGLAKLLNPASSANGGNAPSVALTGTEFAGPAGTPLYMSPEQAFGEAVDARTDVWSLGVVLFESLTGRAPFHGENTWALLKSISEDAPPSVRSLRPEVPAPVEAVVSRALTKDVASRYQSAAAMGSDAGAVLATVTLAEQPGVPLPARSRAKTGAPLFLGLACVVAIAAVAGGFAVRAAHRNWARDNALPTAKALTDVDLRLAAYRVLNRARSYMPGDTALAAYAASATRQISITSSPPGAQVAIQDYLTPDSAWFPLGTTPLHHVTVPTGYFRWRVSQPGHEPLVVAPLLSDSMAFALDSAAKAPAGMVRVNATRFREDISFIGWVGPYLLPAFYIDRYEVTNRAYQQFVDSGGYRDRRYWRDPFADHGRAVSWDDAMARFRDSTGRPGPSTWSSGHYPNGKGDYPVAGVSWYEARAYAAFRGKDLPTMAQWRTAAPVDVASYIGRLSNMSHVSVARAGAFNGVGPYGTYDMAGNVREWTVTATDSGVPFILGGAWGSPFYLYADSETLPPFDRSAINGFRCVIDLAPNPPATMEPVKMLTRDFAHFVPASDAVFAAYKVMYRYDNTPLDAKVEGIVQQTADWRVEKVSFNTAYRNERMAAFLYIPTHVRPPYQTVIFFPSARVLGIHDSRTLGDTAFFDYVVQSGRAVLYPVYQDTYERRIRGTMPGASQQITLTTERFKDVARAIDYLETRADIDHGRLAYLGVSAGAAEGAIYATLEQARLRTAIFLDGGYFLDTPTAGGDQADFVPRMKKPVLMVNGRYDATFTYTEAQLPMFRMLGTPAADKKLVVLEAAHDATTHRSTLVHEVLAWLDKYLGRVE